MKWTFYFLLIFLCPLLIQAQTGDESQEEKLQRYKAMHEQGLIDSAEYTALRRVELFGLPPLTAYKNSNKRDGINPAGFRTLMGFGVILSGSGIGNTIGGIVMKNNGVDGGAPVLIGGTLQIIGGFAMIIRSRTRKKAYLAENNKPELVLMPRGQLGVGLNF